MRQSSPEAIKTAGDLGVNIASIGRHIRAENVSPQTFIAYVGAARQFYRCLAQVGQQAMFESVQPYNRGNTYLSILRELHNADKQRLNPVVSTTSIIDQIKLRGMISPTGKFRIITDPSKHPELEVGTELMRVSLEESVGEIGVDRKFKYWQVFGSIPKIAEGLAVVSALAAIKDEVKCVIDQFSPFLRA